MTLYGHRPIHTDNPNERPAEQVRRDDRGMMGWIGNQPINNEPATRVCYGVGHAEGERRLQDDGISIVIDIFLYLTNVTLKLERYRSPTF